MGPRDEAGQERLRIPSGKREADITVKRIVISGDTSTVDLSEGGTTERWTMLRQDGQWRIDSFGGSDR